MAPPPYNETAILELIDNQAFYNANLGPFLCGLSVQMFMMGVLGTPSSIPLLLASATYTVSICSSAVLDLLRGE